MTTNLAVMIAAAVATIDSNADHLTELDQAIGDGDHGLNMRRGFNAVADNSPELGALELGPALNKIGMTLVMKVGGASGPLYGSFFMAMGKALTASAGTAADSLSGDRFAAAFDAGVTAVKQRGKSDVGEKTMLDVLVPVSQTLRHGVDDRQPLPALLQQLQAAAEQGLQATIPMQASKGRASFLGERSIGHQDPGATSSQLLIQALCRCLSDAGTKP